MIAVSLSQQEEEHSTTSKHTQAHMEDVLGTAHSLLSWHTRHQLTGEFRFQEEESQPSQPAPNSPFFSRPTQFFFHSPLATTSNTLCFIRLMDAWTRERSGGNKK
jgi:hypothetical protein